MSLDSENINKVDMSKEFIRAFENKIRQENLTLKDFCKQNEFDVGEVFEGLMQGQFNEETYNKLQKVVHNS